MGTKNNPGKFDCYTKAEPDEPMFVLLGRDPSAHLLVELWALLQAKVGTMQGIDELHNEREKTLEALTCAAEMKRYARQLGRSNRQLIASESLDALYVERAANVFEDLARRLRNMKIAV
jgi:hypothetical protein